MTAIEWIIVSCSCQFHAPDTLQDLATLTNRELGAGQGRCYSCGEKITPSPHGEWNSDPRLCSQHLIYIVTKLFWVLAENKCVLTEVNG
jgi:hypothetical protein